MVETLQKLLNNALKREKQKIQMYLIFIIEVKTLHVRVDVHVFVVCNENLNWELNQVFCIL